MRLECGLDGRRRKPAGDALLHPRHENAVTETLPALLGLVYGHDRPAARHGAGSVENLAFGQLAGAG